MTYQELKNLFCDYEDNNPKTHLTAYITFSSFGPDENRTFTWEGRTYAVSSNNKGFRPNLGGYSIFGSALDGSDQGVRLESYMKEEHGGSDGWVVENCLLVGYLLIEHSDVSISAPKLFYSRENATEHMLARLAEEGKLDIEHLKTNYFTEKTVFVEDEYRADRNSAWLAGQCVDWYWNIQPTHIYDLLNIAFPVPGEKINQASKIQ